jgi:carboxymethylenebutenolidase
VSESPRPAVLVLSERYGLVEYVKDVSRRLAREGYVALAPEMRSRRGAEVLLDSHDMLAVKDCAEAIRYLQALDFVEREKIGVLGFCWGGLIAGLLACLEPALKAAVIYYGTTRGDRSVKHPVSVAEIADGLRCPLLGLYAEHDTHPTLEDVRHFEDALKRNQKNFEFKIFQGAKHGFHNDAMPERYDPQAAQQAWQKTIVFLETHLA